MKRTVPGLAALVAGVALLVPAASFAASPAGTFGSTVQVDTQDADPCVADYGLAKCDRPGGIVSQGQKALLLTWDGGDVVQHRSTDGGQSWTPAGKVGGVTPDMPAIAQDGQSIAYGYRDLGAAKQIRAGWAFGFGELEAASFAFNAPRQVTTEVVAEVNQGIFVWAAAGYDEVPQGRNGNAIRIHRRVDGIGTPPVTTTLSYKGGGCQPTGTDVGVAVTDKPVIVLAYWKDCDTLMVRRSRDLGKTFGPNTVLSTRTHAQGLSIDAHGHTVVVAYTADGTTWVRRSTDDGSTWSSPKQVGSGATSLRVRYADGAWHLLAGGTTSVRYRHSANGLNWSAGETVDSLQDARTYAIGVTYVGGAVRAAYSIRQTPSDYGLFVAPR